MIKKLIGLLKRNPCKDCDYYRKENNVCQSKKVATCGNHPYVNWFDRHFCEPYKAEGGDKNDKRRNKSKT